MAERIWWRGVCLVSRDKIPQLCVLRNPNENVASVKRERNFAFPEGEEDPLTASIQRSPLSSTIVSLRVDKKIENLADSSPRSTLQVDQ